MWPRALPRLISHHLSDLPLVMSHDPTTWRTFKGCPLLCFFLPLALVSSYSLQSKGGSLFCRESFLAWSGSTVLHYPTPWRLLHSALNHSHVKWLVVDLAVRCFLSILLSTLRMGNSPTCLVHNSVPSQCLATKQASNNYLLKIYQ